MSELLTIVFLGVLSFMAMDYTLGRALVSDPVRLIVAAVFAVLVVIFTNTVL